MENDLISRQATIELIERMKPYHQEADDIAEMIANMPSAQPEITRCKDCKHRDPEDKKCDCGHGITWQLPRPDEWFCADAERRTDE